MAKFNDVTVGQMEACINRMGGMQKFLDFIGGKGEVVWQTIANLYSVIVYYDQSLAEMISAGKYDWKNSEITEKSFPSKIRGQETLNLEMVHFNRNISSDSAVEEMYKMGLRPATLRELLSFGAKYPEIQREFPVVALGDSCRLGGDRHIACLGGDGSDRNLFLHWWHGAWDGNYRFLAVRK